jgi:hypothetical protein
MMELHVLGTFRVGRIDVWVASGYGNRRARSGHAPAWQPSGPDYGGHTFRAVAILDGDREAASTVAMFKPSSCLSPMPQ